jgi:hypothetical protein
MDTGYSLSDVAAVTRSNDGYGCDGFGMGGWWMIIIFAMIFGWGNGGFGGNQGGNGFTQAEVQRGFDNSAVIGKLDRLGDGLSSLGYELNNSIMGGFNGTQRDMCTGFSAVNAAINAAAAQSAECCCATQRAIDGVNYNAAMNTASINATTTAQTQKILDAICGNRMADMQNQINALQLQSALCGVVRYPNAATYNAGNSIWNSCCCASAV